MQRRSSLKFLRILFAAMIITSPAAAWDDGPECREVVKKFKINRSLTITERGRACRDDFGNWSLTTPSRYSNRFAEVYLKKRGKLIYIGTLPPMEYAHNWHNDDHDDIDFGYREPKKCKKKQRVYEENLNHEVWLDENSYKKHSKHHFFD